jgi:putative permease
MAETDVQKSIFGVIARGLFLAVALALGCLFLHTIKEVILIFLLAMIISIALTPLVNWLALRKIHRGFATVFVLIGLAVLVFGMSAVVAPRLKIEINHLVKNVPRYSTNIKDRALALTADMPSVQAEINDPNLLNRFTPALETGLSKLGGVGVSFVSIVVGLLVLISMVAYMLAFPQPLIRGMLQMVPPQHREKFKEGYIKGADMIVRWVWANAIIGMIDAVLACVALRLIHVQGAYVWGAFTLFAEMVPQLGAYLMAIPPTIVALATDPMQALWVIGFYICLQQLVNHILAPMIRARTMRIHPVSEIFAVLSLTLAFGIVGAVIADPVLGFIKAFYDAFYGKANDSPTLDGDVQDVLHRKLPA